MGTTATTSVTSTTTTTLRHTSTSTLAFSSSNPMNPAISSQDLPTAATIPVAMTTEALPTTTPSYNAGLAGVNELGNYFYIDLLIAFFVLAAVVLISLRLWKLAENHLRHINCVGAGRDHQDYWKANRTTSWPWLKRHILYAPLWAKRHNRQLQLSKAYSIGTLPSRLHASLLGLYLLSNLTYCLILDYSQPKAPLFAELRGRSGALATFNLIPTITFALRNNPLIGLLRVSYDTFNLFHRWLARIVILEGLIHVLCWAVNTIPQPGGISHNLALYISNRWAMVGIVIFVLMAMLAWSPIRHAWYETFINVHRLFALLALVAVFEHLALAGLPQTPYVVLVAVFWAVDWAWRSWTILFLNFSRGSRTIVTVEALPREACRITFSLVRRSRYRPGSHAHVYIPKVGLWSSHPFSLAWSEDRKTELGAVAKGEKLDIESVSETGRVIATDVSCIIRAESGMTRKLYDKASAAPDMVLRLAGAVEGPYGGHESLDSYGTVLLFAGGVGITHQLGFVRHLVEGHRAGTVAARRVHLVWSITYTDCLEWVRPFMDEILAIERRRDVLQVELYVTRGTVAVASKTGTVRMHKGRCDIPKIVDAVYQSRVGSTCVTICGPGSFSDDVRQAVRAKVELGAIDFIEEAFTY